VDYENKIYEPIRHIYCGCIGMDCEWAEYYDKNVEARYWYNRKTGEATWIKPTGTNNLPQETLSDIHYSEYDKLYNKSNQDKIQSTVNPQPPPPVPPESGGRKRIRKLYKTKKNKHTRRKRKTYRHTKRKYTRK
jgi:hypothetical protein